MTVFFSREDYVSYLKLLREAAWRFKVEVFHYCLMPNHIHLLVRPSKDLAGFMHAIQMPYAKRFCRRRKFVGHVWQGRYKSLLIPTDGYLFACGNYIEMNPVRAGLVARPEDWSYSSYRFYAFGERDPIVTCDPFYPTLGAAPEERQCVYRETVAKTRASSPVP